MVLIMIDNANMCYNDVLNLIQDVNPEEIVSQILSDNLAKWCLVWRIEMRERLSKLVRAVDDEN